LSQKSRDYKPETSNLPFSEKVEDNPKSANCWSLVGRHADASDAVATYMIFGKCRCYQTARSQKSLTARVPFRCGLSLRAVSGIPWRAMPTLVDHGVDGDLLWLVVWNMAFIFPYIGYWE